MGAIAPGLASLTMAGPYFLKSRSVKFMKEVILAEKFVPNQALHVVGFVVHLQQIILVKN